MEFCHHLLQILPNTQHKKVRDLNCLVAQPLFSKAVTWWILIRRFSVYLVRKGLKCLLSTNSLRKERTICTINYVNCSTCGTCVPVLPSYLSVFGC